MPLITHILAGSGVVREEISILMGGIGGSPSPVANIGRQRWVVPVFLGSLKLERLTLIPFPASFLMALLQILSMFRCPPCNEVVRSKSRSSLNRCKSYPRSNAVPPPFKTKGLPSSWMISQIACMICRWVCCCFVRCTGDLHLANPQCPLGLCLPGRAHIALPILSLVPG